MTQGPKIRKFERRDEPDAVRLLVSKMPPQARERAFEDRLTRWRWQYYDNPSNPESEPILWVAEAPGTLAGLVCPLAVKLRTPKGLVGASWCNDWIVSQAYRGTGLGWALEDAWVKTFPVALGRGWSDRAYAVSVKLGLVTVPGFWRAWIVLSRTGFARALVAARRYRKLRDLACLVPRLAPGRRAAPPARLEASSRLPQSAGKVWERVSGCYAFSVERDLKYLNWRYEKHPTQKYVFLEAKVGEDSAGLAVIRLSKDRPPLGVICDLLVDPNEKPLVDWLVREVLRQLGSMGACAAVADFPSRLAPAFFGAGRPVLREEVKILVGDSDNAYGDMGIHNADSWYLSRSDSDIDFSDRILT